MKKNNKNINKNINTTKETKVIEKENDNMKTNTTTNTTVNNNKEEKIMNSNSSKGRFGKVLKGFAGLGNALKGTLEEQPKKEQRKANTKKSNAHTLTELYAGYIKDYATSKGYSLDEVTVADLADTILAGIQNKYFVLSKTNTIFDIVHKVTDNAIANNDVNTNNNIKENKEDTHMIYNPEEVVNKVKQTKEVKETKEVNYNIVMPKPKTEENDKQDKYNDASYVRPTLYASLGFRRLKSTGLYNEEELDKILDEETESFIKDFNNGMFHINNIEEAINDYILIDYEDKINEVEDKKIEEQIKADIYKGLPKLKEYINKLANNQMIEDTDYSVIKGIVNNMAGIDEPDALEVYTSLDKFLGDKITEIKEVIELLEEEVRMKQSKKTNKQTKGNKGNKNMKTNKERIEMNKNSNKTTKQETKSTQEEVIRFNKLLEKVNSGASNDDDIMTIAECYETGKGTEVNIYNAIKYYEAICNETACRKLINIYKGMKDTFAIIETEKQLANIDFSVATTLAWYYYNKSKDKHTTLNLKYATDYAIKAKKHIESIVNTLEANDVAWELLDSLNVLIDNINKSKKEKKANKETKETHKIKANTTKNEEEKNMQQQVITEVKENINIKEEKEMKQQEEVKEETIEQKAIRAIKMSRNGNLKDAFDLALNVMKNRYRGCDKCVKLDTICVVAQGYLNGFGKSHYGDSYGFIDAFELFLSISDKSAFASQALKDLYQSHKGFELVDNAPDDIIKELQQVYKQGKINSIPGAREAYDELNDLINHVPSKEVVRFNKLVDEVNSGNKDSITDLALCYETGNGTDIDINKAIRLYESINNKTAIRRLINIFKAKQDSLTVICLEKELAKYDFNVATTLAWYHYNNGDDDIAISYAINADDAIEYIADDLESEDIEFLLAESLNVIMTNAFLATKGIKLDKVTLALPLFDSIEENKEEEQMKDKENNTINTNKEEPKMESKVNEFEVPKMFLNDDPNNLPFDDNRTSKKAKTNNTQKDAKDYSIMKVMAIGKVFNKKGTGTPCDRKFTLKKFFPEIYTRTSSIALLEGVFAELNNYDLEPSDVYVLKDTKDVAERLQEVNTWFGFAMYALNALGTNKSYSLTNEENVLPVAKLFKEDKKASIRNYTEEFDLEFLYDNDDPDALSIIVVIEDTINKFYNRLNSLMFDARKEIELEETSFSYVIPDGVILIDDDEIEKPKVTETTEMAKTNKENTKQGTIPETKTENVTNKETNEKAIDIINKHKTSIRVNILTKLVLNKELNGSIDVRTTSIQKSTKTLFDITKEVINNTISYYNSKAIVTDKDVEYVLSSFIDRFELNKANTSKGGNTTSLFLMPQTVTLIDKGAGIKDKIDNIFSLRDNDRKAITNSMFSKVYNKDLFDIQVITYCFNADKIKDYIITINNKSKDGKFNNIVDALNGKSKDNDKSADTSNKKPSPATNAPTDKDTTPVTNAKIQDIVAKYNDSIGLAVLKELTDNKFKKGLIISNSDELAKTYPNARNGYSLYDLFVSTGVNYIKSENKAIDTAVVTKAVGAMFDSFILRYSYNKDSIYKYTNDELLLTAFITKLYDTKGNELGKFTTAKDFKPIKSVELNNTIKANSNTKVVVSTYCFDKKKIKKYLNSLTR